MTKDLIQSLMDSIQSKIKTETKIKDIKELEREKEITLARQETMEELSKDFDKIAEEVDPQFSLYMEAIHFLLMSSDIMLNQPAMEAYAQFIEDAEDDYGIGLRFSPIYESFFNMWAYFDVVIPKSNYTLAAATINVWKKLTAVPEQLQSLLMTINESRMGFYLFMSRKDKWITFRELITNKEYHVLSTSEYAGNKGEVWFIRHLPFSDDPTSHILMTSPYVIKGTTEQDWIKFFEQKEIKQNDPFLNQKLDDFMKRPTDPYFWLNYIADQAYDFQEGAIFLKSVPSYSQKTSIEKKPPSKKTAKKKKV